MIITEDWANDFYKRDKDEQMLIYSQVFADVVEFTITNQIELPVVIIQLKNLLHRGEKVEHYEICGVLHKLIKDLEEIQNVQL